MNKFSIIRKSGDHYWYYNDNDRVMNLLAKFFINDIRSYSERKKKWLSDPGQTHDIGNSCETVKIDNKIILYRIIFEGEEGYLDPDFIPQLHFKISTHNMIRLLDEWELVYKKRPEKIIISQDDNDFVEITALTPNSPYFGVPLKKQENRRPDPAATKFAIMGIRNDYFWYGDYNDESLFLLVDFLIDTYGKYDLEVRNERIGDLKQFLLSTDHKVYVAERYILAKFDDKVILHQEILKMDDYKEPETFPDRRFEMSLKNMIKIINEWSDFIKSVSKAKIMFIQKNNELFELSLIID